MDEGPKPRVLCRCFDSNSAPGYKGRKDRAQRISQRELRAKSKALSDSGSSSTALYDKGQLHFVNLDGPKSNPTTEARREIRSHVMNDFYSRKAPTGNPTQQQHLTFRSSSQSSASHSNPDNTTSYVPAYINGNLVAKSATKSREPSQDQSSVLAISDRATNIATVIRQNESDAPSSLEICPRCGHFRSRTSTTSSFETQGLEILHADALRRSPLDEIGVTRLDPFNVSAIDISAGQREIIDHYTQRFVRRCFNPIIHWSDTMAESVLIHVALYLSSMHRKAVGVPNMLPVIYFHRGEVVRLINGTLEDPLQRTSDAVISSIMGLAAMRCLNWTTYEESAQEFDLHFSSVETIVRMRGGLDTLGMNGLLAKQIRWIDVCHSNLTSSLLRFSTEYPQDNRPFILRHSFQESTIPETVEFLTTIQLSMITEIIEKLNGLTSQLTQCRRIGPVEGEARFSMALHDQIMTLELQAYSWYHRTRVNGRDDSNDLLTSFYIVMNIFIYFALRTTAINCAYFNTQADRLKTALEALEPRGFRREFSDDLLLWILFTGGIASRSTRSWFKVHIIESCYLQNLDSWEDAKAFLLKFPFTEACEVKWKELWNEINSGDGWISTVEKVELF